MRCSIADCAGEYEQKEVVRAIHQGDRIIVVEHIPAEVCDIFPMHGEPFLQNA